MYGTTFFTDSDVYQEELENILENNHVYIVTSYANSERIQNLLDCLEENGKLTIVSNRYDTPLYYWERE